MQDEIARRDLERPFLRAVDADIGDQVADVEERIGEGVAEHRHPVLHRAPRIAEDQRAGQAEIPVLARLDLVVAGFGEEPGPVLEAALVEAEGVVAVEVEDGEDRAVIRHSRPPR